MKKLGFKAAPTNVKKNHVAGSFGNSGQKVSKHGANAAKPAKESLAPMPAGEYMKKAVADMRKQKRAKGILTVGQTYGSGAYH